MPVTKPNFDKPIIYGDIDKWGGKLNKIIDQQEAFNQEVVGSTTGIETDLARLEREKLSKSEANEIIENKVDNYIDANKKPELDAYTENLKLNNIKPYVDVKKTEINTHTETKKAELDSYVNTVNKVALNTHTETKKAELNTHNTVKKEELDTHTTTKKTELDTHTNTKKTELNTHVETVNKVSLNTHTEAKKVELNTHTTTKKTELDSYNAVKKNELDVFTEQEKTELDAHEKLKEAEITTHSNTEMELITGHANGEKLSIDVFTEAQKEELDAHEKLKEAELDSFNENQKLELVKKTDEEIERIKAVGIDGVLGEIEFNTGDNYVFERSENAENSIGMISRRKKYKLGELVDEIYIEKQNKNDNDLKTESKSIVGAINEIKVTIGSGGAIGSQVAQNKANVESLTSTKADKTEVNSLGSQVAQNKTDIENKVALKVDKTTKVVAGKGLVGGGDLSSDKELNIASVDEGIIVNDNDIKLNIVDDLITGGVKRPLSAEQGKVLKQLLDTIGTGGVTRLMRQAEMLSEYDYLGTLPSGGKSIATGKQLFDPSLYLNGIRIEPNKFSVGLTTGLITLNDVYSDAYDVIWLVEDKMPHHITFCFPTMNLLTANADMKNRIAIGDVIKILGESDADDGGHYLVKCEASAKLNAVDIGSGRFLNEIPNTRINEKVDKGGYNGTALDLHNESVKKSGDTMTGRLVVKELQISGIEPSLMNSVGSNLIRSSSSDANITVVGNIKGKTIIDSLSNPTVRISSATTEQTIYHTGNKPSKADIGLGSVSDFPVTSSVSDSSNSKYATAGAVKQAYDRASSGINEANTKVSKAGDTMTGTLIIPALELRNSATPFVDFTRGSENIDFHHRIISMGSGRLEFRGISGNQSYWFEGSSQFTGTATATKFLGPLQGNADTATSSTKLTTARQINGTNFDGTANITTSKWGTARSVKVGNTAKNIDGSGNIEWTMSEIGAVERRQIGKFTLGGDSPVAGKENTFTVTIPLASNSSGYLDIEVDIYGPWGHTNISGTETIRFSFLSSGASPALQSKKITPVSNSTAGRYFTYGNFVRDNDGVHFDVHFNGNHNPLEVYATYKGGTFSLFSGVTAGKIKRGDALTRYDVYSTNFKPTASDVGALPLSGGSMTGPIKMNKLDIEFINDTDPGDLVWRNSSGGQLGRIWWGGGVGLQLSGGSSTSTTTRIAPDGSITSSGNITAYSDIKLKEDLEVIPDALDKIGKLNGYTYTRKDSGERHSGVVAQEVQAVLPEVITSNKDEKGEETLSVAYGNMVGLLIEGIKELRAENKVLAERLAKLEVK